jgi:hypothetical protein
MGFLAVVAIVVAMVLLLVVLALVGACLCSVLVCAFRRRRAVVLPHTKVTDEKNKRKILKNRLFF